MTARRAFTLVEVLLALGVAALVLAALVPALTGVLRAQRRAAALVDQAAREQAALSFLADDLLAAPRPAGSLAVPFVLAPATVGGRDALALSFLAQPPPPLHPGLAARPAGAGQVRVSWALEEDPDGGLRLVRSRQVHLLAAGIPPEPAAEPLLGRLAACTAEALADGAWVRSWDSDQRGAALPLALRLRWRPLGPGGEAGDERIATFPLPLAALDRVAGEEDG